MNGSLDEAAILGICRRHVISQLVDYDIINDKLPGRLAKAELYQLIGAQIEAAVRRVYLELAEA